MELNTYSLPEMKLIVYHGSTISTLPYKNVCYVHTCSIQCIVTCKNVCNNRTSIIHCMNFEFNYPNNIQHRSSTMSHSHAQVDLLVIE